MTSDDFGNSSPGQLVLNLQGNLAFIPNHLPPQIIWTNRLVGIVSAAESALGRLAGLGHKFPRPRRLVRMFLRREAELSSRIENTYAGVRTQLLFKVVPDVQNESPDAQEVVNNFRTLEFGLRAAKTQKLSLLLIRQMHQILMKDVRGEEQTPGEFRRVQAHIGRSADIRQARFVPPPPHSVQDCMEQFERFIDDDQEIPRVARLAMAHYQFECIHPFADGNGRIGRVLILLQMCKTGMLPLPLFNPSAYLETHRREYYDNLLAVSQHGTWSDWIEFFSRGITEECSNTIDRIEKLEALRRSYQSKVRTSRLPANLSRLVDGLFGRPRIAVEEVQRLFDVWPASAQRYIDRLEKLKILREVTGRERNRVYIADKIVDLFSTSEKQTP